MVDYLSLSLPGEWCIFTTLSHSSSPIQHLHTTILLCSTQMKRRLTGENPHNSLSSLAFYILLNAHMASSWL
ncbi:hypothetical protein PO909_007356 [Leuciscus waleckii]